MKRLLTLSALLLITLFLLAIAAGSLRYGSINGLIARARAEISARSPQDHPALVPTPLPTPTPLASQIDPTASPWATLPPTPRPPATPTAGIASPGSTPLPAPTSRQATGTVAAQDQASTATPAPLHRPAPASIALSGFSHVWQTWNNCGPATLAMQLSYFGSNLDQEAIRLTLRPHPDDKNVLPAELADFARAQGYQARVLVNGDDERLKTLLANGIPVLIETWLIPEPNDGMGHYRLLSGYDDDAQQWIAYDAYVSSGVKRGEPYTGIRLDYAETADLWRLFNRTHLIIYTNAQTAVVNSILAADSDEARMQERALSTAQTELDRRPDDPFAWFNLGSNLVALRRYDEAAAAYDQARQLGLPWRMMWYQFGPFRAYHEVGRHAEVLALADATLATTQTVEEIHYWRGMALRALGDDAGARQSLQTALDLNPNFSPAAEALSE